MKKTASSKFWSALVLFGLMGQIAWVVENMYLNVFIYEMFNASAAEISAMVTASAISAAVTTILMGALSDRVGKRRLFISAGYILWGISIFAFALLSTETVSALFPMATSASAIGVTLTVILDCVMTFFGSSANDAAFNAWLTDSADEKKRGAAEGVNAMMPLVAILAVFGGFMGFQAGDITRWRYIFPIIGAATLVIGVLGFFLIEEPPIKKSEIPYLKSITYGFLPSTVRKNPSLYLTLALFAIFNISIQIFMPYLILYYEKSLLMSDYVLIMAPAVILASVVTALWGRVYDKKGFGFSAAFSLAFLLSGYLILYLTRDKLPVFIGSLLMMSGFLSGGAVFGAKIRDLTPKGKSGMLQGIRIVSQVLIPGIIGPFIGAQVLKNAETIQNADGTESFIPNASIFIAALAVAAVLSLLMLFIHLLKRERHTDLTTPYDPDKGYTSHPRPQMKRTNFTSLNGLWSLSLMRGNTTTPLGEIRVPFPPESTLSGIHQSFQKDDLLVYTRSFQAPEAAESERVFLHFGAVDCHTEITLNGKKVGSHSGGYLPFSFDITPYLANDNLLTVTVKDNTDPLYPYGKQTKKRGGMWYTPISGIWQTVWLEVTPENPITSLKITQTANAVTVETVGGGTKKTLTLKESGKSYAYEGDRVTITPDEPHLWSPDDPYLYHFTLTDGEDTVESYFALRSFDIGKRNQKPCLLLNGKPIFCHGVLDQGYFPDGIFTPAEESAYTDDIALIKSLGFNMIRKHIKIEPECFYYDCDRLGVLVFQDLVNSGKYSFFRDTALPTIGIKRGIRQKADQKRAEIFENTAKETILHLHNHPSIVQYTVFNEGWGQYDADRLYSLCKSTDPTRLYDTASGWFWENESDFQSEHIYFKKLKLKPRGTKPLFLSEFGGYSYNVEGHTFNLDKTYGYKKFSEQKPFEDAFVALYENEVIPMVENGLTATVYTQLSDVEDETNGLVTYDRRVVKVTPERIKAMSDTLYVAFENTMQ